jgi:hypothetical protein
VLKSCLGSRALACQGCMHLHTPPLATSLPSTALFVEVCSAILADPGPSLTRSSVLLWWYHPLSRAVSVLMPVRMIVVLGLSHRLKCPFVVVLASFAGCDWDDASERRHGSLTPSRLPTKTPAGLSQDRLSSYGGISHFCGL